MLPLDYRLDEMRWTRPYRAPSTNFHQAYAATAAYATSSVAYIPAIQHRRAVESVLYNLPGVRP